MLRRIVTASPVRGAIDRAFQAYASFRRYSLDTSSAAESQTATLLRLVHQARTTRFGQDHDFTRIRSIAEFQKRVPLREYEQFWQEYWHLSFPHLTNATWPGSVPYLALSSGTTAGTTKYIPVTRPMLRANRRAALTALSWFRAAYPRVPLFTGSICFLGGSTELKRLGRQTCAGDLSGIAAQEVPSLLRSFTFPPLDVALLSDWDRKLKILAERSLHEPITFVSGVPSWLLVLFEEVRRMTGCATIAEAWPHLRLVIHGGTKFDPYRERMRSIVGSNDVHYLETYPASEGFVAAEDPRHGLLRLITDNGIFYEFVPVEQLGTPNPVRHTVGQLEVGVHYAVVLTTCAGLWSYVLGDTICFERHDPPLFRFTGRTKQFLSAFGEHLIGEEVERAIAVAAARTGSHVVDFHVGPVFPKSSAETGRHRYFIEFASPPSNLDGFIAELDSSLSRLNDDYASHRQDDLTLAMPEVIVMPRGSFAEWMRWRGKLGGQHKVPRLDNTGRVTDALESWLRSSSVQTWVASDHRSAEAGEYV